MPGLRSSFLCSAAAVFAASAAAAVDGITTAPDYFVGWYHLPIVSDRWTAIDCANGYTYSQTDRYGSCCPPAANCDFATDCEYGTLSYASGEPSECASSAICQTMTIYKSATTDPRRHYFFCDEYWDRSTLFRLTPSSTTTSPATDTTGPTPGPAINSASATSTAASSPGSAEESSDDGGSSSKAWIAGAVVGPVAGCAIIAGALGFWLYRRGAKKGREAAQFQTVQSPQTAQAVSPAPMQGFYEQKEPARPLSELPSA